MEAGIHTLKDITDAAGALLPWENRKQQDLPLRYRPAYQAIGEALHLQSAQLERTIARCNVFLSEIPVRENSRVWVFKIERKDRKERYIFNLSIRDPSKMFRLSNGALTTEKMQRPVEFQPLSRVIAVLPSIDNTGKPKFQLVASMGDAICLSDHFTWKDGREIFSTSTKHLRAMLYTGKAQDHISIHRWSDQLQINVDVHKICKII